MVWVFRTLGRRGYTPRVSDSASYRGTSTIATVRSVAALYATATGLAIGLAVVSLAARSTVFGSVAFMLLASVGAVATRLAWDDRIDTLLDPVSLWALAGVSSASGWGLLLAGDTQPSWLCLGGALLGGALVGALRRYTSLRRHPS